MYYLEVVQVLQMSEDQATTSMLCLLRGWSLQAVLKLTFRFWLSETGEVVLLLGEYLDIIERGLSICREENCDHANTIRSKERSVMEEKLESENGQAEGRIKNSLAKTQRTILSLVKLVRI